MCPEAMLLIIKHKYPNSPFKLEDIAKHQLYAGVQARRIKHALMDHYQIIQTYISHINYNMEVPKAAVEKTIPNHHVENNFPGMLTIEQAGAHIWEYYQIPANKFLVAAMRNTFMQTKREDLARADVLQAIPQLPPDTAAQLLTKILLECFGKRTNTIEHFETLLDQAEPLEPANVSRIQEVADKLETYVPTTSGFGKILQQFGVTKGLQSGGYLFLVKAGDGKIEPLIKLDGMAKYATKSRVYSGQSQVLYMRLYCHYARHGTTMELIDVIFTESPLAAERRSHAYLEGVGRRVGRYSWFLVGAVNKQEHRSSVAEKVPSVLPPELPKGPELAPALTEFDVRIKLAEEKTKRIKLKLKEETKQYELKLKEETKRMTLDKERNKPESTGTSEDEPPPNYGDDIFM